MIQDDFALRIAGLRPGEALRSGGRRSATARTVTRSKRRFRAKTKIKSVLALTAPTLAPCHPSLRCVFPRVRR